MFLLKNLIQFFNPPGNSGICSGVMYIVSFFSLMKYFPVSYFCEYAPKQNKKKMTDNNVFMVYYIYFLRKYMKIRLLLQEVL